MAKLFFTKDVSLDSSSLIRAVKTDTDSDYVLGDHNKEYTVIVKEISDDEYDDFFNGTKVLTIESNEPVLVAATTDSRQVDQAKFTETYDAYKKNLEKLINIQPDHSQIVKAQACLTFLNDIDVSSLSYPTDTLQQHLIDNNVYVKVHAF